MTRFRRVCSLGDGGFVWTAPVLATTWAGTEARTLHGDGSIIAWEPSGAIRTRVETRPSRVGAWVDERLALLQHEPPSYQIVLRAIDEPTSRWSVFRGSWLDPIVVLPCRTMFSCDARGNGRSAIYSLDDGSMLEESAATERWTAIGRYATYRCAVTENVGAVTRSWFDTDRNYEEERAPSTYTWRLERDGKTLLEYDGTIPDEAWFADDEASITIVIRDRVVVLSLPDLRQLEAPAPKPPALPAPPQPSKCFSLADVPELSRHPATTRPWSPQRSATERVAMGGGRALVTDVIVGPASVNPPSFHPTTRQLQLFSLDNNGPRLVRVLSELSWRDCPAWPLVAVSADGALGVDAAEGEPTLRVWELATGAALDTIDLGADEDCVRAIAFGEGQRLFVETVRGRVFGYEPPTPSD